MIGVKFRCMFVWFFIVVPSIGYSETINISTIDWCPFICPSNSEYPGLLVEYTKAIYSKTGLNVSFKVYPWSRAIKNTERGSSDALLAPAKNEAPKLVFPETEIGTQRFCFFSLKEDSWKYEKPESVIGKKILYPQDALPEVLKKFRKKAKFIKKPYSFDYLRQTTGMLQFGRTETVLMTYYSMVDYLNKNNLSDRIILSGCVTSQNLYLAFSPDPKKKKRVEKLIAIFERNIKILKREKYFEGLLSKYKLN